MVGEAYLPSYAYYPRTPDYTLYSVGLNILIRLSLWIYEIDLWLGFCLFVCVEVLWPSQPNGVMSSTISLPNHTFTGQA